MITEKQNGHRLGDDGQQTTSGISTKGVTASYPTSNGFSILNHLDKLEPTREKNKYICPVCGGNDFSVRLKDGAFTCYSSGCDPKDIMNVLAPLPDKPRNGTRKTCKKSVKEKDRAIHAAVSSIETKVDELVNDIEHGRETKETAQAIITEWCKHEGRNRWDAQRMLEKRLKQRPSAAVDDLPKFVAEYRKVKEHFGKRLRFNEVRKEIELDDQLLNVDTLKLDLAEDHGLHLKSSREDLLEIIIKASRANTYNPVADYLDRVTQQYHDDTSIIDNLATRYFGTDEPLHNLMVKRMLIAAVGRILNPGCKHDWALILQGAQGAKKSSWFKELAGAPWFDDSMGSSSDKDERIKMSCRWFIEWSELETVFRRKDVSQVKAFMTSGTDFLRPPYGRVPTNLPRQCVLVGTTNETNFLSDPTGARRFLVVPVRKVIDIELLKSERDRIWAAANILFHDGERHWWEPSERDELMRLNQPYQTEHPWKSLIADRVEGGTGFTTQWVLGHVIGLEPEKQNTKHLKTVCSILRELNFEKTTNAVAQSDGRKKRVWRPNS